MAKIFYSVMGEGRGHATRVRTLVESLRREHKIVLFTYGEAHQMLSRTYRGSEVIVHRIPGLRFGYSGHSISYVRTIWGALRYLRGLSRLVGFLEALLYKARPDLLLTNFEPAPPRDAL